ncbi:MAG TPA: universal stress protein [Ilumatobacteraceae bacterium]|nr:universal stress protein [Ilumatobacteraceae bacterium]
MNEIIVGVDESATARNVALQAGALAASCGKPLHIVMAVPSPSSVEVRSAGSEHWHIDSINAADQTLRALAGEIRSATPITHAVIVDTPAQALCSEAVRLDASMIAVGNKQVQAEAGVLGSIAGDVAKQAPCNVLIVPTT